MLVPIDAIASDLLKGCDIDVVVVALLVSPLKEFFKDDFIVCEYTGCGKILGDTDTGR